MAQLLHLPATSIAHELGCTPNNVNVLLRQLGLICAPAGRGRPAGIHFTPDFEQVAVIAQFRTNGALVLGLSSVLFYFFARFFN